MHIIHIILGKANPHRANGVNKVVHSLACWLVKNKIETEVWGITDTPASDTPKRPYPLRLFKASAIPFQPPEKLISEMKKLKKDTVIHFHGVLIPVFSTLGIYCCKIGIPYVVTPHSALSRQALQRRLWRKKAYLKLFETKHLNRSARVQALAISEAQDIRIQVPSSTITVIPNGIDIAESSGQHIMTHSKISLPIFGYIGRVEKYQKGLDLLLEGFSIYRQDQGTGVLYIVGDGPDMEWMENKIPALALEHSVHMTGALFGSELLKIRSSMTTVIHPSRWEGIAMSLLESLALGIPGVVSAGTNLAHEVSLYKAGWAIADNDARGLATAMKFSEEALLKGRWNDLSLSAKKLVKEKFSWDYAGNRLLTEIYAQIINP